MMGNVIEVAIAISCMQNIYQDPLKRNYLIKCLKIIQILEKKKGELYLFNF